MKKTRKCQIQTVSESRQYRSHGKYLRGNTLVKTGRTVSIVLFALFRIRKHGISFADLLELGLEFLVAVVLIRMVL